MLRFDKFIEASKNLPSDLRDALTTIRELDLVVQNAMDKQESQAYMFFQNALTLNSETRDLVFQSLLSDFANIAEVADEKVNIAQRLQTMLTEHLEILDGEIASVEIELESENPGVTEILQERVLMSDYLTNNRIVKDKLRRITRNEIVETKGTISTSALRNYEMSKIDNRIQREIVYESIPSNIESTSTDDLSLYCICNKRAFGNMIACDNELCPYEWFHYDCVNMTNAPEGKWYCPKCIVCKVCLDRH